MGSQRVRHDWVTELKSRKSERDKAAIWYCLHVDSEIWLFPSFQVLALSTTCPSFQTSSRHLPVLSQTNMTVRSLVNSTRCQDSWGEKIPVPFDLSIPERNWAPTMGSKYAVSLKAAKWNETWHVSRSVMSDSLWPHGLLVENWNGSEVRAPATSPPPEHNQGADLGATVQAKPAYIHSSLWCLHLSLRKQNSFPFTEVTQDKIYRPLGGKRISIDSSLLPKILRFVT